MIPREQNPEFFLRHRFAAAAAKVGILAIIAALVGGVFLAINAWRGYGAAGFLTAGIVLFGVMFWAQFVWGRR